MRGPLFTIFALAMLLPAGTSGSSALLLELRVFNGPVEVTAYTRITVHRAGERAEPIVRTTGREGGIELQVPEGIYDVQAIEERDGQVVNIQWAHRLVVMSYPDEKGRHLEVLNFKPGFGALQVRTQDGALPEVALQSGGGRDRVAGAPLKGAGYTLFVVPAGSYDVTIRRGDRTTRHADVEVPRDRTRLWLIPEVQQKPRSQTLSTVSSRMVSSRNGAII